MNAPRQPRRRFMTANGSRSTPMRECPIVADEPDMVDRIAAATNIRDEPEMVGPAILGDYAEVAALHRSQQHARDIVLAEQVRPLLKAEDRLKDIHRRAKHGHVDLSHEMSIMRRDIERARAREVPVPQRTLDRLGKVETLLDHGLAA